MNELTERELRRRFAVQDDPAFAPRVSLAELLGEPVPVGRRRSRLQRPLIATLGIAALLGLTVAAVALRRPERPSQPVATAVTTPTVATTPPPATTPSTRDDSAALAGRLLAAGNDEGSGEPKPTAATCRTMTRPERVAARTDFGPTGLPLYLCSLTFARHEVAYNVQLLPNGCFVSHPAAKSAATPAVLGCGVAPAPPVHGLAALRQEIAASVDITSEPVVRATLLAGGMHLLLASFRDGNGRTCAVVATGTAKTAKVAEEPSCGDGRGSPTAGLRIVLVRAGGSRVTVLAGLVDPEVTAIRIGDREVAVDAATIPGTTRRPVLVDLAGAKQAEVLAGSTVIARIGGASP